MEEEIVHIKGRMDIVQVKNIVGADFYIGKMHGQSVIAARCGIGKVNAAICAQVLIDMYAIDYCVNVGVAGALNRELNIGDVIISKDAIQHDFDASAVGDPVGSIPRLDVSYFPADPELTRIAEESGREVLKSEKTLVGRVATGDVFVSDIEKKKHIWQLTRADCVDMEGAAVAQTCYLNRIPFVIIRAVSDKADKSASGDFRAFLERVSINAANIVEQLVKSIVN